MASIDQLASIRRALGTDAQPEARQLLMRLVRTDPTNGEAWYVLSTVLDDAAQRAECLSRAAAAGYSPPRAPTAPWPHRQRWRALLGAPSLPSWD